MGYWGMKILIIASIFISFIISSYADDSDSASEISLNEKEIGFSELKISINTEIK